MKLTVLASALLVFTLLWFGHYLARRRRKRRGSFDPVPFGGRFALSGIAVVLSLLLPLFSVAVSSWHAFDASVLAGRVKASREGQVMNLDLTLDGVPPQIVKLKGRYWVVRFELLAFNPRLRLLGLRNYYRIRYVDGLESRGDRIAVRHLSRKELADDAILYLLLNKIPFLDRIAVARLGASSLKEAKGVSEIWITSSGSAG